MSRFKQLYDSLAETIARTRKLKLTRRDLYQLRARGIDLERDSPFISYVCQTEEGWFFAARSNDMEKFSPAVEDGWTHDGPFKTMRQAESARKQFERDYFKFTGQ